MFNCTYFPSWKTVSQLLACYLKLIIWKWRWWFSVVSLTCNLQRLTQGWKEKAGSWNSCSQLSLGISWHWVMRARSPGVLNCRWVAIQSHCSSDFSGWMSIKGSYICDIISQPGSFSLWILQYSPGLIRELFLNRFLEINFKMSAYTIDFFLPLIMYTCKNKVSIKKLIQNKS